MTIWQISISEIFLNKLLIETMLSETNKQLKFISSSLRMQVPVWTWMLQWHEDVGDWKYKIPSLLIIAIAEARATDPSNLTTRLISEPNGDNGDKANKDTN